MTKVVSEATLRPQDLIPAFMSELRERDPTSYEQIATLPFSLPPAYAQEDPKSKWWDSEEADEFVNELVTLLDMSAEPGEYFGTLEGDPACFGFFSFEKEET